MITPEPTPREMLAQLEAQAEHGDELMGRAIEAMRDMINDHEIIASLQQRAIQANMARTGFVVELAMALREHEQGATILQLFKGRRPILRVVQ